MPLGVFKFNSKRQQTSFTSQNQHYQDFSSTTISWLIALTDPNLAIQIANINVMEVPLDFDGSVLNFADVDLNLLVLS